MQAFTDSLNVVFLVAAAIGLAAFALSWLIKELPLRDTVATAGVGEAFAVPKDTDPLAELARELSILSRREAAGRILERLAARAGVDLRRRDWLLARLNRDEQLDPPALAVAYEVEPGRLERASAELAAGGLVTDTRDAAVAAADARGRADTRTGAELRPRTPHRASRRLAAGPASRASQLIDALASELLETRPLPVAV